ncbi:hypothetical protein EYV94_15840 [Puteibacter caeruleilacunae]|nr:hypothetical protein EYV94_15840 [Puteibacter caeruleilacunae]
MEIWHIIVGGILLFFLYSWISDKIQAPRIKLQRELNICKKEKKALEEEKASLEKHFIQNYNVESDLRKSLDTLTEELNEAKGVIQKKIEDGKNILEEYNNKLIKLQKTNDELLKVIHEKDSYYKAISEKKNDEIEGIASLYADHLLLQYDITSKYLRTKKRPAPKTASDINDFKKDAKQHIEKYRLMKYKYDALFAVFPELSKYVEDFETIKELEDYNDVVNLQEQFDRSQYFLEKEEYEKLNEEDRNQLALENYINKHQKTNWQIGRDYELYCGQFYENNGWEVEYCGMEKRFEDKGRDLIARKDGVTLIIQCKYWSKNATIHENHICQLYGTAIEYELKQQQNKLLTETIRPVFITNNEILSETAKAFANKLGVDIIEDFAIDESQFRRIKCNIGKNKEMGLTKIYHLPYDQQYERIQINTESGDFYASTVKEAMNKGFRRAFKYRRIN